MPKPKLPTKLDFDLKLPFGYISYTQMSKYLDNPKEYYEQYMLGHDFMEDLKVNNIPLWEKITLGGIWQDGWAMPAYNWAKQLQINNFTADKHRIFKTSYEHKNLLREKRQFADQKFYVTLAGIKLVIKPDGWNGKRLLENKFGSPRGQIQVDMDNQLSFYALGCYLNTGKIPSEIILQSVNDKTGSVRVIPTKRTPADLEFIAELIITAARGISAGIWE